MAYPVEPLLSCCFWGFHAVALEKARPDVSIIRDTPQRGCDRATAMRFWRTQIWTLLWARWWIICKWVHLTKYQCKLPGETCRCPIHVRIIPLAVNSGDVWLCSKLSEREVWHPVVFPPPTPSIKGRRGQECLPNTCPGCFSYNLDLVVMVTHQTVTAQKKWHDAEAILPCLPLSCGAKDNMTH